MDSRDNPIYWSFPCGNWFMTHVRVSVFVPLVVLAICFKLNFKLGVCFGVTLLCSLLIHEFSHILAVRWTGGVGNEILIWPLGGLAFVQPASTFRSQFLTPAAGPLAKLLCGIVVAPVWHSGAFPHLLNPLEFPISAREFAGVNSLDLFKLVFWTNWMLLLANLLPVFPLDGIRMVLAVLKSRTDVESAAKMALRISFWTAFIIMTAGVVFFDRWALIVFFGAVVLFLSLVEWIQMRPSEALEDSFMGYDFSQGYTSLERSSRQDQPGISNVKAFSKAGGTT